MRSWKTWAVTRSINTRLYLRHLPCLGNIWQHILSFINIMSLSPHRHYGFALLFVYWLLVNIGTLHNPFDFFSVDSLDAIKQVELTESTAESPKQLPLKGWSSQSLPDDWYASSKSSNQVWYRVQIPLTAPNDDAVWSVYLPTITHNAAVYINGLWVGQGGEFSSPVPRHHNDPLLFSFSSELLHTGINEIHIRVMAEVPIQGFLGQFYLAPEYQLIDSFQWKHLVRVDFVQWITLGMYTLSVIILAFWVARPKELIYGLFALQLAVWATHNLNLFVTEIPTSALFWEAMTMSTFGWVVVLMILFNHRYIGNKSKPVERFILTFSVLGIGLFFLPNTEDILNIGYKIWNIFLLIFGLYSICHLGRVHWLRPHIDTYLMLFAGIPILVFGFHDVLLLNHIIDRSEGLIVQYSVIPAVVLFSWFLIRRFVQSLNVAEQLSETLEQRVQEKQLEIQAQYTKLQTMENERILAEERDRIMRDMHDGLGGHLVSLATLLQEHRGKIFDKLRQQVELSLLDLRIVIDSMDPTLNDLPSLLGTMRMRLMEQLNTAQIELEWAITELPDLPLMTPRHNLHIMRIIQEAVTNTVKHANASKLHISTGMITPQEAYIRIHDNGNSAATNQHPGRGIKNMHYRARQLGAMLNTQHQRTGYEVHLTLPVK